MTSYPRRNKFGAVKVKDDGYTFDSKREHKRYTELKLLVAAKEISNLKIHPRFDLIIHGKKVAYYSADFEYIEHGRRVVEDVKGGKATQTPIFKLKWKIVQILYPDINWRIV